MERDQASKFVNDLLRLMVSRGGSDLFLTADFMNHMVYNRFAILWINYVDHEAHAALLPFALLGYALFWEILALFSFTKEGWREKPKFWLGLPFLLAAGFLAQLVAALFRQGEVVQVVLLAMGLPFFFLSGFAWPVEAIPAHLHALAQLIPSTAAIDGLVRVTQMGATLPEIAPILWHLWALAAGLGLVVLAVETVSPSRPAAPDRGPTAPSDSPAR